MPPLGPQAQQAPQPPPRNMVVQRPAQDAMAAMYGTILQRNFAPMAEGNPGYWWRKRMIELGFASTNQIEWRLDRIPFTPTSPGTMFISRMNENGATAPTHYTRLDGTTLQLNDHLGLVLRDYLLLLTEAGLGTSEAPHHHPSSHTMISA